MDNFTLFTYQHTCKKGQPAYILKSSPFKAVKKRKENGKISIPFLGEGYYFWEENRDMAYRWGKKKYLKNFNVVEYEKLKIPKEELLDLINRIDTQFFIELIDIYLKKRPKSENWGIANWIEFFKKIKNLDEIKFPFKYIRAEENLPNTQDNNTLKRKMVFADDTSYYTYLSPLLVLCVLDKKTINAKNIFILP